MQNFANRLYIPLKAQAERLLRWAFCLLLLLIIIPSGSVNFIPFHRIAAGLYIVAACAALLRRPSHLVKAPYILALSLALVLGGWVMIQSFAFYGNPLGNPIWAEAQKVYGAMPQSISVTPGDTMEGVVFALLPFAIFITTLILFASDKQALNLIRAIVVCGIGICILGLIQFSFSPTMLVFDVKRFYLESLTTVFVNRNTAATYIGMILIFAVGLAVHSLQNAGWRSFVEFLINGFSKTKRSDALAFIVFASASAAAFVALMLTQSRAGIASSLIALTLMLAITVYSGRPSHLHGTRYGFSPRRDSFKTRVGRVGLAFGLTALLGFLFAGLAIFRASKQGTSDLRFCFFPRLVDIAKDNWLVGTGFGTFRDVYPAYRNPACGMDGVLFLAHNFYLEGWISLGIVFVAICVIVIAALFSFLLIGIRNRRQFRWVSSASLAVLVLQVLHNSVDFSIQNPGVASVFAALTGSAVVIARGRQQGLVRRPAEHPQPAGGEYIRPPEQEAGSVATY